MTRESEILAFTEQAQENIVLELYNKAYSNLESLNGKVDKYSNFLILIIILFFVSSNLKIDTLQIGPITIKNTDVITIFLPVLYFSFIYNIMVMAMHKSELYFAVKNLGKKLYKSDYTNPNTHDFQNNFINRVSLPFSYSSFGKQMILKNGGIINALFGIVISIPALIMIISLFLIGFLMLKDLWMIYYSALLGKFSFWISLWIAICILYTIKTWSKILNGESLNV